MHSAQLRTVLKRAIAGAVGSALIVLVLASCALAPSGTLTVLSGEVEVNGVAVTGTASVSAGQTIEVGDGTSVAQLDWRDGSVMRLAPGTSVNFASDVTRVQVDSGTAWSAVSASAGQYLIATDQGNVTGDAGSSFAVRCADGACDGVVAAGGVTIGDDVRAEAPATFVIGGGADAVAPAGWDAVYGDDFALANAALDTAAGRPTPEWVGSDASVASLNGTFEGPNENVVQSCTGWAEECARVEANIFSDTTSSLQFTSDCSVQPCTASAVFTLTGSSGSTREVTAPMTFDGTSFDLVYTFGEDSYCFFDDGRAPEGRWTNGVVASFTPAAAEVRDGVSVVTSADAVVHNELVRIEGTTDPTCAEFEYEWSSDRTAVLTLQDSTSTTPAQALASFNIEAPAAPVVATGPARPSVLSDLRTPAEAIPTLGQLAVLGGAIVVLVLVLGYPAFLLSRVVADRYEAAVARRGKVPRRVPAGVRWLLLLLGVIVASLITAALDPSFGAPLVSVVSDPGSIGTAFQAFIADTAAWRLVGTAFLSFVVFLGLGSLVVRLVGRRVAPGVPMPLQFRWGSLLILLAGVVVSRVLDVNPGIIFGLVAGLLIADSIPIAGRGRLMLAAALFSIGIGAVAWTGYAVLAPIAAGAPDDLVLRTGTELLSALTIEAVSVLPLAFLPVVGLDGFVLRKWRILAWIPVYAIGLALFALVLLTVPGSFTQVQRDAIRWLIGFGAFTVVAIVIWVIHLALQRRGLGLEHGVARDDQGSP